MTELKFKDFAKYLQVNDFIKLLKMTNPYNKADLIFEFINDICIIQKDCIYVKKDNDVYAKTNYSGNNLLVTLVSKLYSDSIDKLTAGQKQQLRDDLYKEYKQFEKNTEINQFIPQLSMMLTREKIVFDYTPYQIHFNNGYVDVRDKKLHKRNDKHYITKCISRDYKQSTKEERQQYMNIISQIYPNKSDRDLILLYISIALSWQSTTLSESLFFIGLGSSGKSTIFLHLQLVMECYFHEFKNDTFSNDKNIDKVLNTFSSNPQILFAWINEMDSKRCNAPVYKSFCDGVINTVKLYKEESHNTRHYALCIATSNELPNMPQDSGSKRRMKGFTHTSKFVKDKNEVDEANNIYFADPKLSEKIAPLYNAIFDIYCDYCYQWINGRTLDTSSSKNLQDTTSMICDTNDYFQDFIDKHLLKTNNEKHRIGKEAMKKLFLETYPEKHVNVLQVISALVDKGIKYNKDYRSDGVKGSFYGVKIKNDVGDIDDEDVEHLDEETINQKIIELQKQLKSLQKRKNNYKPDPIEHGVEKKELSIPQKKTNDDDEDPFDYGIDKTEQSIPQKTESPKVPEKETELKKEPKSLMDTTDDEEQESEQETKPEPVKKIKRKVKKIEKEDIISDELLTTLKQEKKPTEKEPKTVKIKGTSISRDAFDFLMDD